MSSLDDSDDLDELKELYIETDVKLWEMCREKLFCSMIHDPDSPLLWQNIRWPEPESKQKVQGGLSP